ncbi:nucleoid-associated protein [Marinilabiliaceae bacterium JC017]|nr:nucleoid-associated protein [Marinilabiliaceae bacterium JC017]
MIDNSQLNIESLVVHQIGCRAEGENIRYSKSLLNFHDDESVEDVLKQYFFKPFKTEAYFNFDHPEGLEKNVAYSLAQKVFDGSQSLYDVSIEVANLLYQHSNHPKIRGGEFYMGLFRNVVVDGEVVDALGIFKSENKETFLKVFLKDQNFELGTQEGINIKKLDKGCIIFNTEREAGYKVCSVDNLNKGNEARFWSEDFLGLKPREDNYYFTNNYLQMCKGFVGEVFNEENDVPRPDQIEFLNRSMDFFDKRDNFSEKEFEREVIRQPEVVDAFQDYKNFFELEKDVPLKEDFDISQSAVKGEKRNFKSVLKLDKNFHVYVHGKRQYIEKGFDNTKGLNFYKLYYEVEH